MSADAALDPSAVVTVVPRHASVATTDERGRPPAQRGRPVRLPVRLHARRPVRRPVPVHRTPPERPWNGHDRRASDPMAQLSRRFDTLCVRAVDAVEIAAGLEANGFTDGAAREYDVEDVFTLAERLFEVSRPGRGRDGRPHLVNPWSERPSRHLVRGIAFAAPGLVFVACLPAVATLADRLALVAAMLVGWPGSQVMAYLGHMLQGRRMLAAARAVLRLGLAVMAVLAVVFGLCAHAAGVSAPVTVVGSAEVLYLGAAAALLVLGHERVALAALAPGVLASLVLLVAGTGPSPWRLVAVAGAAASLVAVTVAAVAHVAHGTRSSRSALRALTRPDLLESRWHLAYGVVAGGLVTLPSAVGLEGRLVSVSLVPVIWSMGLAEWQLVRLRSRSFDLLNEAITIGYFHGQVRRLLTASIARYTAGLLALTLAVPAVGLLTTRQPPSVEGLAGLGFGFVVGVMFFHALVIAATGGTRVVVLALATGLAAGAVALALLPSSAGLLVAPCLALALLLRPTREAMSDPTLHM